ncbi:MAG: hypothetical protein JXR63_13470 [Spirochaetales bacterium]|nr:hypothetical protein [Spirochaetales bacterium]
MKKILMWVLVVSVSIAIFSCSGALKKGIVGKWVYTTNQAGVNIYESFDFSEDGRFERVQKRDSVVIGETVGNYSIDYGMVNSQVTFQPDDSEDSFSMYVEIKDDTLRFGFEELGKAKYSDYKLSVEAEEPAAAE